MTLIGRAYRLGHSSAACTVENTQEQGMSCRLWVVSSCNSHGKTIHYKILQTFVLTEQITWHKLPQPLNSLWLKQPSAETFDIPVERQGHCLKHSLFPSLCNQIPANEGQAARVQTKHPGLK